MPFQKYTNDAFIKKAISRWGDRYDYSAVDYKNSRTPVKILCNKHQKYFYQSPKAHFTAKHHCCPLCYKEIAGYYQNIWRDKPKNCNLRVDFFRAEIMSIFK
ncbi:hypothetical protein L9W80_14765 [Vibrio aestuarianus]|uniref:hypothetical protein n=1 Tax=Vibrio aestuarianus TaxID=28171 RepID=UPI00237CB584|nr:hypothetical protein [Vibrio aestuarianus]MDE1351410.1 hypothetical protein [Vibrio aestuarianus]